MDALVRVGATVLRAQPSKDTRDSIDADILLFGELPDGRRIDTAQTSRTALTLARRMAVGTFTEGDSADTAPEIPSGQELIAWQVEVAGRAMLDRLLPALNDAGLDVRLDDLEAVPFVVELPAAKLPGA